MHGLAVYRHATLLKMLARIKKKKKKMSHEVWKCDGLHNLELVLVADFPFFYVAPTNDPTAGVHPASSFS